MGREEEGCSSGKVLLSPSTFCSPHDRPMNLREEVLSQGRDFNGEQADQEDGRLVPKITILLGSGCQVFYQSERKK